MHLLKIFKAYGAETSQRLVSTYLYSNKESAIAEAIKCVPKDIDMKWTSGLDKDDVVFYFEIRGTRFQFCVSEAVIDVPVHEWREDGVL